MPGSGRSPGEGNGSSLQYSCLENPMDGGAWRATVQRIAKSRTRLTTKHSGLGGQLGDPWWRSRGAKLTQAPAGD